MNPDGPLKGWVFRGGANMVVFIGAWGPDGPLTGWVAEAAMKAVENPSSVDRKCIQSRNYCGGSKSRASWLLQNPSSRIADIRVPTI